jgi:hypothetical protein
MALPKTVAESVTRMARDARFIFTGTVEASAASSIGILTGNPNSKVVLVEHVHRAAPTLEGQAGQRVTVLSAEESGASGRRVFFSNPILYGETVAVKELGSVEAPDAIEDVHSLVTALSDEAKTEELRQHLASAEAVLHGRVLSRHRVSRATAANASEHDPDWWAAVVHVIASFKGRHEGDITVRYPHSRDVRWHAVPKPQEGQEALFVLHRDGINLGEATLALIHPGDVLPADARELRRVRSLL